MNKMSITAVVTVRNGEKRISRALDSIARQTRKPDHVFVVDGHSSDRTVEIAQRYGFVTVIQQEGLGIADAYNQAIRTAESDLIAFLSHDDEWTENKIEIQAGYHEMHPETLVTTAMARFFAEDPGKLPPGFRTSLLEGEHVVHIMETLMARKEVFVQVGLYNQELKTGEDVDWFSRVQDAEVASHVIREVLLHKYVHAENASLASSENNAFLLRAVRDSIRRKREQAAEKTKQ